MDVIITAEALAGALGGPTPPVLLDVRWSLAEPDGRPAYRAGHLPGAVFVELETELARPEHEPAEGRHPLPDEAAFTESMRRWGIRTGDAVVVYDDLGNQSAARAWWLLRHAGVADARLLDGGLAAWRAAGLPLETGDAVPTPGDATARYGHLPVVDIDGAERMPRSGVLLDARAAARYRGEVEPVDPIAGHVPGAASAPTAGNLDADGRFLPADALRARYEALGVVAGRPVAAYCGSGVTAAHAVAALAIAGFDAALYPGSWSQWANTPGRPVETGGA
ncbi:sulfurtransferase [Agromyces rhizosphaerae]|uniref:Sulfurtransferase n=1 Tax=Agromyces rhizosphaerae TaxID=88374 RepID=A0A9W6FRG7_9MICO|nr:sulfurtransferase [Agromyces rhizosphaerae]GLI27647.1 sulfurtransferase [Agromyces rhizosphaerae]